MSISNSLRLTSCLLFGSLAVSGCNAKRTSDPNTMIIARGDGGIADATIVGVTDAAGQDSATVADAAISVPETGDIRIHIVGVPDLTGQFTWGLFTESEADLFPDTDPAIGQRMPITESNFTIDIPYVVPGRYAVAVYQDTNSNGMLDKGSFGQPLEKWGSTNNVTYPFHAPDFDESSIEVEAGFRTETTIMIHN